MGGASRHDPCELRRRFSAVERKGGYSMIRAGSDSHYDFTLKLRRMSLHDGVDCQLHGDNRCLLGFKETLPLGCQSEGSGSLSAHLKTRHAELHMRSSITHCAGGRFGRHLIRWMSGWV